jgi:UDP-N-acetylglucosamine acyltransferase
MTHPFIHPTALVAHGADLAPDVRVGPYAVIDGPVSLAAGCVVRAHAHLIGPFTAGENNDFGSHCVIGDRPQHLAYKGEVTELVIGHGNTFREHATVHRGMPGTRGTRIGDNNYFMVGAHVGHDCRVGDHALLVNGAMLGGHSEIGDRALISGNAGIHQFCRVGRLALVRSQTVMTMDSPPFWVVEGHNHAAGVNVVGMRRAGIPTAEIQAVRKAFRTIYRGGRMLSLATAQIEAELGAHLAIRELIDFIRSTKRGIPGGHRMLDSESQAA